MRSLAISIPLLVDPCGAVAMNSAVAARVTALLTVEDGAAVPGPTGQQLCHYLQLSGVPAKPLTVGLNGRLTGEAILEHANALSCDLLIKGAYTQSRTAAVHLRWHYPIYPEQCDITGIYGALDREIV